MATELGQAYVQIMPSAKGISGSIQKAINPEATAAGKSAGSRIVEGISKSMKSVGKTLTKSVTVPALGAATAISGVVGAFGWGRLTGLDSARAKLQGLGYDAKAVERISGQVRDSIQGTVTTMAEGVSIAAGGLAAGVKEGAELERYIKLVGDAAVGANRPVNDMAQIFNRVQGSGRLMTQELNMIEDGMPGFAMAMANSLGVPQDKFREMVTSGKVSSEQFLDVMEDFAGDMSDAYANSWAGMVANTKSNIGIIGESLLSGVFQQSKESIAEFLEYLRSDDVKAWAKETGKSIGQAFERMIESVKNAINWWTNLDGSTQKLIMTITGIAIAAGPVLMILSKLINTALTLGKGFTMLKTGAAIVGTAIGSISAPVLIVIGVISGLIALFTTLYQSNEGFRDLVQNVWSVIQETISTVIQAVSDFVMEIWSGLVEFWNEHGQMILQAAQNVWSVIHAVISETISIIVSIVKNLSSVVTSIFNFLWPFAKSLIISTWSAIKGAIDGAIKVITGIIQFFAALFTGNWSEMWAAVKQIVSGAVQFVVNFIQVSLVGKALKLGRSLLTGFVNIIRNLWTKVTGLFKNGVSNAYNTVTGFFKKFKDAGKKIVTSIAEGIKGAIDSVTDAIGNVAQKVRDFLPFSPPKTGPLTDIMDVKWGETIGAGIEKGESDVAKAMDDILAFDLPKKATFNDARQNSESNPYSPQQKQPIILQVDGKTFAQIMGDYTSQEGGKRIRRIERGLA